MELKNQPKLYSTETGEVIQADPAQISQLVSSGKAAFKRGEIIPVIDANGSVSGVPAEEFTNALSQGFQYEPLESQQKRAQKEEYGSQPIRAGLEGAARGVTLGLSDLALRGMGADAEGLAGRKEFNPVTSTLTEVGGAIAPILLTGGGGAAAKGGAMAAAKGAARYAPSALAARAGTAALEATEAAIGSGAAKSLAGKIAKSAIPMAAGSAVEGAIYSAGNVVSEAALGDPDINAEKAIAQIGMGAALGGALGGLVGTVAAPFGKKTAHVVSELDNEVRGVNQATEMAVNAPTLNEAERKAFNSGIGGVAPDAKDIKRAGEVFGVEVFPEQVTSNSAKKSASAILDNSVSPTAIARNNMKQDSIRKVVDGIEQTVGSGLEMTEIQAGKQMKDQVKAKFDAAYEPSQRLYKIVDENIPHIEVADKAKTAIIANLKKMDRYNINGSLEKKAADFVIDNLPNMKTAKDIQNLSGALKDIVNMTVPGERRVARMISEKLDNLVEASTVRAGEKLAAETGDATIKAQLKEVLQAIPESKKAYASFRDKLDTFAGQLGKSKISGKAAFEEFLDDLEPHKLMSRMFDKKDDAFLKFLAKEFPEEANLLFQHKKTQILEAARKAESVTPIFREVEKMAPEVRALVFRPDELEKLKLGEKYLKTISYSRNPSFGNPSRAAYTESAIDAFSSPKAALTGWARDATIKRFIETGAGFDGAMVSALKSIEGAAQKVTKELSSTVKTFLTKSAPVGTYLGVKTFVPVKQEEKKDRQKEFEKQQKEVTQAISNPEVMSDNIAASFSGLGKFAPKMAEAATYKATAAVSFLYEKMPKNPLAQENIFSNKQWKPSDFEISKWMKYVNTVEDPMGAFKDLKKGRMTIEQSETLKTVYPELYGEATKLIMEELPKLKEELPYQKRVQLGVLFDVPTDPSLNPAFVAQMQLSHAGATQQEAQKQGGGKVSASRADKLNFADKTMTNTQRVITRA